MAYNITFKISGKRLKKNGHSEAERILKKLTSELSIKADQFPELQGPFAGLRKYGVGNYRVIYAINILEDKKANSWQLREDQSAYGAYSQNGTHH